MAVELLVKATEGTSYGKGSPVVVKQAPGVWGSKETLPMFIVVVITGVDMGDVRHFVSQQIKNDFNASRSGNRITVTAASVTVSGKNSLPVQRVRSFIMDVIGGTNISWTSNSVSFDLPPDTDIQEIRAEFIDKLQTLYSTRRYYQR